MARPATSSTHPARRQEAINSTSIEVNKIGVRDLRDALVLGYDDFLAKPSHLVLLCIIYPIAGLILCRLALVMPILGHATWHLYRKVVHTYLEPAHLIRWRIYDIIRCDVE